WFLAFERGPGGERRRYGGGFVDAGGAERFPEVGFVLSTSSATDSHEWEEFQAGVFSHEVRSGLRGAADADGDGRISYAEIGAFVQRANAAVPNPRFRPRFAVVPPRASADGPRTAVLDWASGAAARRLLVDAPVGRLFVEDRQGVRVLDANPAAGAAIALHLPRGAAFVRAGPHEYALPSEGDARLAALAAAPSAVGRRGALHEAFKYLFAAPFDARAVASYMNEPEGELERASVAPPRSSRATVRRVAGWTGLGAALAGAGLTGAAFAMRSGADDASQVERAQANGRIHALNIAALASYGVAAAAGATWLALELWPDGAGASVRITPR
ncbi:MAG: hypothetical protein AABZ30_15705, partial [Myxococcota bacterium]